MLSLAYSRTVSMLPKIRHENAFLKKLQSLKVRLPSDKNCQGNRKAQKKLRSIQVFELRSHSVYSVKLVSFE